MSNDIGNYVSFMKNLERFTFCMNSGWEKIIKEYGLTISSYPFFDFISNNPGVTQQEMANIFEVDKAISSRACNYLEGRELIERKADNRYSHGYGCYLTEKGMATYQEVIKKGNEGIEKIFSDISIPELESAGKIISLLYQKINESEGGCK